MRGVFEAGFYNQGEACIAGSRVLVHRALYAPLLERLSEAVRRLRVGAGARPGTHVGPPMFSDVRRTMRIAQEEIFGPVVSVLPVDNAEEAVSIANENEYGLVGAVFTRDQETARKLDAGMVYLNNHYRRSSGMPFGGVKASGHGREHSIETLKEFGWTKLIRMPSGLGAVPVWPAIAEVGP